MAALKKPADFYLQIKKGPERSEGTINYMRNRRRERSGDNNMLHNSSNNKHNMTNRKKSLII